jgi:HSP20 family protein
MIMARKEAPKTGKLSDKSSKNKGDSPFLNINRDIGHLFEHFYRGIGMDPFSLQSMALAFVPKVDVYETSEKIKVVAELPGLDENDIDVSLTNDVIIIVGEKKDREDGSNICYKAERQFGWFTRAIPIPVEVDTDNVDAMFKKGVLKIILPKIPEAASKRKKIHIIAD